MPIGIELEFISDSSLVLRYAVKLLKILNFSPIGVSLSKAKFGSYF